MSVQENNDGYPGYMRQSIELIEKTRRKRLDEIGKFEFMNLNERREILEKFHPDWLSEIRIGGI